MAKLHDSPETGKYKPNFRLLQSWTKAVDRHYLKKTYFVERVSFLISNIHISTPLFSFQCCNHVFQQLKAGEGGFSYRQKKTF